MEEHKDTKLEEIEYYYCYGNKPIDPETAREDIKYLVEQMQTMGGYISRIKYLLENEAQVECYKLAKNAEETYREK